MKCLETDGVNLVDFGFYDSSEYTNTLSIMFWIKVLEKVPSNVRFFGRFNGFNIGTDENGALRGFIRRKDATVYSHVSNKKLSWDLWTHIAITYQNDDLFLYVNGYGPYIYSFNDNKNEIDKTASTKLSIGGLFDEDNITPSNQCKCRVSHLSLWNIPVTPEIIGKHMRKEIDPTTSGLLHYWKIDEGNGTKIYDCSGNLNGIVPTSFKWVDDDINLKGIYQDQLIWLGENFSEIREKSKDCRGQIFQIKKPFYIEGISIPVHIKEAGEIYIVLAKFRPKGSTEIPQGKPTNIISEWVCNIKSEQSGVFIIPTTPILLNDLNTEYIIYNWFLGKRDIMYHDKYNYEDDYFKTIGSIYSSTPSTPQDPFTWTIWNDATAKAYICGFLVGEELIPQKLFLIIDGSEIKTWDGVSFVKIGELPLTEDMFLNYGVTEIPNFRNGISSNAPELVVYSPVRLNNKNISESFIPKTELILGNRDYIFEGRFSSINIDVSTIGEVTIKFIISIDEGNSWYWYDGTKFSKLNSIDIDNVKNTSNTAQEINSIEEDKWVGFIGTSEKIRLGIFINVNSINSIAILNKVTLFYI